MRRTSGGFAIALPIAALFIVVQDSLTIFGVQGSATVAIVALLVLQALFSAGTKRTAFGARGVAWPMVWFVAWAALLFVVLGPSITGFQNLLVWAMFPLVVGTVYAYAKPDSFSHFYPWVRRAAVLSSLIYLAQAALTGLGSGGPPYSARGAGWLALLALCIVLPRVVLYRESWWPVALLLATIIASLSRTPMVIAALMIIIAWALRSFRGAPPAVGRVVVRLIASTLIVGTSLIWAILNVPFIRERFTDGDGVAIGGITINSSGRAVLWGMAQEQWLMSPWIGHGPGSAQELITSNFPNFISHPHNEYLRILDDTGVIGMVLWVLGVLVFAVRAMKALRGSRDDESRSIHLSALLGVLLLAAGAITDNVTIALYIPLLVGSMLGLSAARSEDARIGAFAPTTHATHLVSRHQRRNARGSLRIHPGKTTRSMRH